MACSRRKCESIMCRVYIYEIGYICRECMDEFKKYLEEKGTPFLSKYKMKKALVSFMETEKGMFINGESMDADEFFEDYK